MIIVRPESTKRHKAHYDPDSAQSEMATASVGKHRAPKGALRLLTESHGHLRLVACESTEHQKMHYDVPATVISTDFMPLAVRKHQRQKVH